MTALLLVLLASPAMAYDYFYCGATPAAWEGAAVAFSVSTLFSSDLREAADESIDAWGEAVIPGSAMGVSHGLTSITTSSTRDGINIVAATEMDDCSDPNLRGNTEFRGSACEGETSVHITEADVYINACFSWLTWGSDLTYYDLNDELDEEGMLPFRMTMVHEVGHALGLNHAFFDHGEWPEEGAGPFAATMNPHVGGGSLVGDGQYLDNDFWQVSEDDREGLRMLYPDPASTGIDIAVQMYEIDAEGYYGLYCAGRNARPLPTVNDLSARAVEEGLDASECPSDRSTPSPEEPMAVLAGADLDIQYVLLNLGTEWVDTYHWVRLVPSSGSGTSHLLYVNNRTLRPDSPLVLHRTVTIPTSVEPGLYNVEVEVDYGDLLDEVDETNNVEVWNLQVDVQECGCQAGRGGAVLLSWCGPFLVLAARRRRPEAR